MTNFKKILFFLIIIACLITGCDRGFLDVNKNPNVITEVSESLLLPAVLGDFSFEIIGSTGTRVYNIWMQQLASNNPTPNIGTYRIASVGEANSDWSAVYTDVLINAKILNNMADKDKAYSYSAIAKTLTAWAIVFATNQWGPVPYAQALQPEKYPKPEFEDQESIYKKAIQLLDDALDDLSKNSVLTPSNDDLLYHGDMNKWKRMIYTLKAEFELTLTNAPGYDAKDQSQKVLNALKNGFTSNDDDADFAYFDKPDRRNVYWQWAIATKWHDQFSVSAHYIKLLESLRDPRLSKQARLNDKGKYRGHENGTPDESQKTLSEIGEYYSAPDAPLTWISYAEALFMKAEAILRTTGAGAAQPIFEKGIKASMDKLGISETKTKAYIASLPSLSSSSNALEELMTQKYIADYLRMTVYNDWRRTGYPKLTVVKNNNFTKIPRRFIWPQSVVTNNKKNLEATGIPEGTDGMKVRVWWDSK
jgi:hypothetical protein